MNSKAFSAIFPFLSLCFVLVIITDCFMVEAYRLDGEDTCKPSGKVRCNDGKSYLTYKCSPPVSSHTKATLTINSFEEGGDGGGPSECDGKYHSDNDLLVALSTGWFNNKKRCHKYIKIHGNGKSVNAKVVDECDSTRGCAPCRNNIVDASKAVWKALGVPESDWGEMNIYWSE